MCFPYMKTYAFSISVQNNMQSCEATAALIASTSEANLETADHTHVDGRLLAAIWNMVVLAVNLWRLTSAVLKL